MEDRLGLDVGRAGDGRTNLAVGEGFVGTNERAADDALLPPECARGEFTVGREAGEFSTRAGAAGRAIVRFTRTEHKVAAISRGRGCKEFDVVNLATIGTGHAGLSQSLANLPRVISECFKVRQGNLQAMRIDEEKPVTTPSDIAADDSEAWHVDRDGLGVAVRRYIRDGHGTIGVQRRGDRTDRGIDADLTRLDETLMGERHHQSDSAVPAHPERPDIVKENYPKPTRWVVRRDQQGPDNDIGTPRLVYHRRAEAVMVATKHLQTLRERSGTEVWPAGDHHSGRLAPRMGVDDAERGGSGRTRHAALPPKTTQKSRGKPDYRGPKAENTGTSPFPAEFNKLTFRP